ncbi:DUF1501 domain-containing protein [Nocardioides nematodiphilus]|uniref:DUF1501 domain-containing protein n=1 Tax=Nocardioides nematodiphilus TaxID=2849669 RepID=UPI001CD96CAE|nr:DUF1501 domain-containing protein [Nocardioides nematodiphilus]MCA1984629.1 DUF1501 domain-containing protein [Nocardioides nematodiphilus]
MTDPCCSEHRAATLSRRGFLAGLGAASLGGIALSVFGDAVRQVAYAEPDPTVDPLAATAPQNVLVVLSLRGAIDGLGVVVPHGDPAYAPARPHIAIPASTLVAADSMFGLHPAMAPLLPWWQRGQFAAVQAVGLPMPNRSHFSAMEEIEEADPSSSMRRGWVNRMIGLDSTTSPTEAVHLSSPMAPTLLSGPAPMLAADRIQDVSLIGANPRQDDAEWRSRRRQSVATAWSGTPGPLGEAARSALAVTDQLARSSVVSDQPRNGASYPTSWPATDLAAALQDTAKLIRADVGTEVVSIDFGSWDHHADYGSADGGRMTTMVGALASSIAAFLTDLGPDLSRVTVLTISEFGRRLTENGAGGLDHGWGNMMLLLGAGVKGGQYHGTWPGLTASNPYVDDDLAVTTDYRDVIGELVAKRFPGRSLSALFPGHTVKPIGVLA